MFAAETLRCPVCARDQVMKKPVRRFPWEQEHARESIALGCDACAISEATASSLQHRTSPGHRSCTIRGAITERGEMNHMDTEQKNLKVRIDNLENILRIQQSMIDKMATALRGHQAIFEALLPAAVQTDTEARKRFESCRYN
jgi:hypothetical protein